MFKVIMNGYLGKMGRTIGELASKGDFEIVAGIDAMPPTTAMPFPTYTNIEDCDMPADVIIDFSTATAIPSLIEYSVKINIPVVVCTTGLSDETTNMIKKASEKIPVFQSYNMSLGINLLASLLKKAATILYDVDFDIEIIEKHHNQKIDSPSGTALLLADSINEALDNKLEYVNDRSQVRKKRNKNELGIHGIRGGSIVGEHTVLFAGRDEVIEFTHIAQSKEVFAVGAVKAAKFLKDKPAGLYNMQNIID